MNIIELPYLSHEHKLHYLHPLLSLPWAVLLDSAKKQHNENQASLNQLSRFDIFSFAPSVKLTFNGKRCKIEAPFDYQQLGETKTPQPCLNQPDKTEQVKKLALLNLSDPLDCMRKILQLFKPAYVNMLKSNEYSTKPSSDTNPQKVDMPFCGGWLGYISYDFARSLERLPNIARDDIQLPQIQMGLYQWALITDHRNRRTRLHNFGLDNEQWCAIVDKVTQQLKPSNPPLTQLPKFNITASWQSNTSKQEYTTAFQKIQDYIQAGDCYQVNYAQQFSTQFNGNPVTAYAKLTKANQAPFSAYLNYVDHQILCLSPERFIESRQRCVKTQPIKGTRPRHPDPQIDARLKSELIHSEKDKTENLMIVDLLRNDLSRTAAKASVKVEELYQHYQFESVHHLISTITAKLAERFDEFDLLKTTLPGGSITGAPKIRAMEIIEELEPARRNLYCGIIGYIDFNAHMDTNICIRTIIAKNQKLFCWAGGGLVADSELNTEYQETYDKLAKILPILTPN
ncbi:aminodeoxychorismate synthase component I [Aliikangiella maris]|uniref:aminodeoxychorismate synthase n=2 Tax=Aliikangiella maris TaxID=3162458 RepID=A0ABV3MI24_9GAMM